MNQRILKKQLGIKSTMKMRDYFGAIMDKDDVLLKDVGEVCDIKAGDYFFIVTFEPPKLKRKPKIKL